MIGTLMGVALFTLAAPFALYPLVLFLRAALAPRDIASADITPTVDLIICAHNEAASIGAKIENALALDYPPNRLSICIASDGSTDETVEIARSHAERVQSTADENSPASDRIRILDLPRNGKAHALREATRTSRAEVLAFSDANSQWTPPSLRALVRSFADPEVGGVAGDQRYVDPDRQAERGADDSIGERSYWSFDRWLKRWQSRAGNAISATGAIYAIRRSLFQPPPPDATDDFMISTGVIAQGRRLVFCEEAVALEPPASGHQGEFQRKVRITTRGLRAVLYRRALLNPFAHGAYAFELLVHKLWRRLTWLPLAALVLLAPFGLAAGGVLAILSLCVAGGVGAGILGLVVPATRRFKPISIASYAIMVNGACAMATLDVMRGRRVSHWEPARATNASGEVSGSPS